MVKKLWKDISVGDKFVDGSVVKSIHERYVEECFTLTYHRKFSLRDVCMTLGSSHLLKISLSFDKGINQWLVDNFGNYAIPTLVDRHVYINKDGSTEEKDEPVQWDKSDDEKSVWLPVKTVQLLVSLGYRPVCNGRVITGCAFAGEKEVFCVETDSHRFETHGLVHHNSVTLRNIIFHCLTHGENISIALIDLKWTEFTPFKGVKNVVAVANTVREAAEIMRIAKECMYKRNQEMSKLGINDIKDYKPQKPTNEVMIFNRKFNDDDQVEIRLTSGEVKTVTVKELESYL